MELADLLAALWFVANWVGYTWFADWRSRRTMTLMSVTHRWRILWLQRLLDRDMRMVDTAIIGTVLRSVVFFASTTILILAGLAATLAATDRAITLVSSLPFAREASHEWWELVLVTLMTIFVYAFFKFTWSMRQFNYIAYLIGAAPDASAPAAQRERFVSVAAEISTLATRHFNRGLRAYYFALAVLAWFVHPLLFAAVTSGVVLVLYIREFHSRTLRVLSRIQE